MSKRDICETIERHAREQVKPSLEMGFIWAFWTVTTTEYPWFRKLADRCGVHF